MTFQRLCCIHFLNTSYLNMATLMFLPSGSGSVGSGKKPPLDPERDCNITLLEVKKSKKKGRKQ